MVGAQAKESIILERPIVDLTTNFGLKYITYIFMNVNFLKRFRPFNRLEI
jgi:hypothetical protein